MNNVDKIKKYIDDNNGIVTTSDIVNQGFCKTYLSQLEKSNEIERVSKGVYINDSAFEDEYYILQANTSKIIYSHMTALYLHGIAEKIPNRFDITIPYKYSSKKLKSHNLFYVSSEIFDIGITEIKSPYGNYIKVYNIERCICDIIRSKNRMDKEQMKKCIKEYVKLNKNNTINLIKCAEQMRMCDKIVSYMEFYYE